MTEPKKEPLIITAGPTAAGKSAAAIALAKKIGGEIISADSVQVYRGMDIGSAKIREEEREGIPHYLIDILDPDEPFNVFLFRQYAKEAYREIRKNGHIPILTGGTGFYIQAFLYDIDFSEEHGGPEYRKNLEELSKTEGGAEELYRMLRELDPKAAEAIHPNNVKRVIRALEFRHETGDLISKHNEEQRKKESPYDFRYYVLSCDRALLYERIERRVDRMMEEGLLGEVEALRDKGYGRSLVSMQSLGYRQLMTYLYGECTLPEAVERIKIETRHFAKRQLTWFRRERDTVWVDTEKENLTDVYEIRHF